MSDDREPLRPIVIYAGHDSATVEPGNRCVIGRRDTCDLVLHDPEVSREHIEIYDEHGSWYVRDLGSRRGTFVDGEAVVTPRVIGDRTVIRLAEPETGPELKVGRRGGARPTATGDDRSSSASRRTVVAAVAGVVLLGVAAVIVVRLVTGGSPPEDRAVTVIEERDGNVARVGAGVLSGGTTPIVVAGLAPDESDDDTPSYRIEFSTPDATVSAAAFPIRRGDGYVLLAPVGLDALPSALESLEGVDPDGLLWAGGDTDRLEVLPPRVAGDPEAAAQRVRVESIAGDGMAVLSEWHWGSGSLPLVDGDRLAGFAWPDCVRDDGKVRALTVLLDDIESVEGGARSLAGPAPSMQQLSPTEPVELSPCS